MTRIIVELPRKVPGAALEKVCIQAAEELGYHATSRDLFTEPGEDGSRLYYDTIIRVRNFVPVLEVSNICRDREEEKFLILTGWRHGFGSEKMVQEYIERIKALVR